MDILPHLLLALQTDLGVREVINTDAVFLSLLDAVELVPGGGVDAVVKVQAADMVLPVLIDIWVPIHRQGQTVLQQERLFLVDVVLELMAERAIRILIGHS